MTAAKNFDKLADVYEDEIRRKVSQYDELQNVFFYLLPFKNNDEFTVLDLGLGTGETAKKLLQSYPNVNLVGIDASRKMTRRARLNLAQFEPRTELFQCDFGKLPPLQPFDFIYSILAIHHISAEDKQKLFQKTWRMLKPGGCFMWIDVVKGSTETLTKRYVKLTFPFDPEDNPSSLTEQLQWLKEAGFERIDVPWKYYKLAAVLAFKAENTVTAKRHPP